MMFRGWLRMAITSRFGKEIPDLQGGIVRKGRWISYKDYYQSVGAVKGSINIVKSLLMKLAGLPLINKITRVDNSQLFNDLISDEFTEVDAANMRRNMQALIMYGSMMIADVSPVFNNVAPLVIRKSVDIAVLHGLT